MVNSINSDLSQLQRTQGTNPIAAPKPAVQRAATGTNSVSATQNKITNPSDVSSTLLAGTNSNVKRGSLVDVLV